MRRQKGSKIERRPAPRRKSDLDAVDIESADYRDVNWDALARHTVDLDPVLVEQIRARATLKQITLRVGLDQIAEAKRVAAETGVPYQAVMRRWLALGAGAARARRLTRAAT